MHGSVPQLSREKPKSGQEPRERCRHSTHHQGDHYRKPVCDLIGGFYQDNGQANRHADHSSQERCRTNQSKGPRVDVVQPNVAREQAHTALTSGQSHQESSKLKQRPTAHAHNAPFEEIGDQASKGSPAKQRRYKETTGHSNPIRPAGE